MCVRGEGERAEALAGMKPNPAHPLTKVNPKPNKPLATNERPRKKGPRQERKQDRA